MNHMDHGTARRSLGLEQTVGSVLERTARASIPDWMPSCSRSSGCAGRGVNSMNESNRTAAWLLSSESSRASTSASGR